MLRLHGIRISNYYNIVKVALLEKGLNFEEVHADTGSSPELLTISPMGKVPILETEHGHLTETSVILDYLEESQPGPALYPSDPFKRAKVRELVRHCELYMELPARRLYPGAFFGGTNSEAEKQAVRPLLEKGVSSIAALAAFDPYIAGTELTYADFYAQHALGAATQVAKIVYGWDAFAELPKLKPLLKLLRERDAFKRVAAERS